MAQVVTFKQMEDTLEEYYKYFGKQYKNNDGKGKFELFLEENGYELNEVMNIEDEWNSSDNCMFIEFDEEFPFKNSIVDDDKKEKAIFNILKQIHDGETSIQTLIGFKSVQGMLYIVYII